MTAGRKTHSKSTDWGTPQKYVDAIKKFFGGVIQLDPCSNQWSIVGAVTEWSLPDNDGLAKEWNYSTIFVNPPYGRDYERGTSIADWLAKCVDAWRYYDAEVIALIPVATNTKHWKDHVFRHAKAICFCADSRLKFLEKGQNTGKGAPMACALVYWGDSKNIGRFFMIFSEFGCCMEN